MTGPSTVLILEFFWRIGVDRDRFCKEAPHSRGGTEQGANGETYAMRIDKHEDAETVPAVLRRQCCVHGSRVAQVERLVDTCSWRWSCSAKDNASAFDLIGVRQMK